MFLPAGMKFRYRVAALIILATLMIGIYVNLPEERNRLELNQQHRRMLQGKSFKPTSVLKTHTDAGTCNIFDSHNPRPIHANISTFDLSYNTQYNLRMDGSWEMPLPTSEYRYTKKLPKLNVILMPHSHNDPGWLKTVYEYYADQTKHILNNMVNKLTQYPNMTFIWAETIFFSTWWNELDDIVKIHVKRLIRRGQLEIAMGGWVMPDEASTHYVSVIDQLMEGHQWLWENLGIRPQNSWSIDPFGYSGTMPYIWQKAGMSNMVIQRVHQAIKSSLVKEEALEFYWRQMWDAKGTSDIFCHIMPFMLYNIKYTCGPNTYNCLQFDFRSVPNDFSESLAMPISEKNIDQQARLLAQQYRDKAFYFRYNTVLVPIGDDFRYDKEVEWDQQYENYEKLINYIHSKPEFNMKLKWGTLKDYFRLTHKEHLMKSVKGQASHFPILSGDFFPYSDRDMAYWTGYFSTRPFDKMFCMDVQSTIQAADILNTLHLAFYKKWKIPVRQHFFTHSSFLQTARRGLGLFLHHDAITGTAKEFVVIDYEENLLTAYNKSQDVLKQTLQSVLSQGKVENPIVFKPETVRKTYKDLPSQEILSIHETGTTIVFFNPLPQARKQMVDLIVDSQKVEVLSASRLVVPTQISPLWSSEGDAVVYRFRFRLTFMVDLGPLATAPYILYKKNDLPDTSYTSLLTAYNTDNIEIPNILHFPEQKPERSKLDHFFVDNERIQLEFDSQTGSLLRMKDLHTGNVTELNISFQYYKSKGSGAYLFYPNGPAVKLFFAIPVIRVMKGSLMTRVEVSHEPYLTHSITLYHHPSHLATSVFIENKLSIHTLKDKEIIMRFDTSVKNNDWSFFTDQNGFQFIRRKTNHELRIEGNYFPMTSAVFMEDRQTRITLLSAQPHGVSSLERGQLELMLDRQLVNDDNRGLGEGVMDIKTTISKFVLIVERRDTPLSPKVYKSHYAALSLQSLNILDTLTRPVLAYYTTIDTDVFYRNFKTISNALPCDMSVVSLRSLATGNFEYNGTSLILHRRGFDCGFPSWDLLCTPTQEDLTLDTIFKDFSYSNLKETSLTHTMVKRKLLPTEPLNIAPMEISAYHFHFE